MGVHGNGLTSALWMKPSPQTAVMEFFYPEGFAHDYAWTVRAVGLEHFGFWNDTYVPFFPALYYPDMYWRTPQILLVSEPTSL